MQEKYLRRIKVDEQKREETHHAWDWRIQRDTQKKRQPNIFISSILYKLRLRTASLHTLFDFIIFFFFTPFKNKKKIQLNIQFLEKLCIANL